MKMDARDIQMTSFADRRSGENPNAKRIDIGPITLWFSYTTCVAFRVAGGRRVVRRNVWGPTTGKHLNDIDGGDHEGRVSDEEFDRLIGEQVGRFFYPRDLDPECPASIVADWLQDRGLDKAAEIVRQTSEVA